LNGLSLNSTTSVLTILKITALTFPFHGKPISGVRSTSAKKRALAAYLQTNEAKKLIQTNIVANVSQGYYNLLMLDAQLDIAQEKCAVE
jgi:multidrug efflux system outer membrane protein